jgi:hypothetical protein
MMSSPNPHVDRDLDLSNAGRGVWLVKVRINFVSEYYSEKKLIEKYC